MKRLLIAANALAATIMLTTPVVAGNVEVPAAEPVPVVPVPAPNLGGDWTGFYAGVQLGYMDISGSSDLEGLGGDGATYGLHAGYNYDFGRWVLGAELDYDWADVDLDVLGFPLGASVDSAWRGKLRGGYDFGNVLLYATLGYVEADVSGGGISASDSGDFYGVGLSYKVNQRFVITGEYLMHNFDDFDGEAGADLDADTITIRASWQF